MNFANGTVLLVLCILIVWLGILLVRMKRDVIIYSKALNLVRLMFCFASVFSIISIVLSVSNLIELVRSVMTLILINMFIFLRDGLCEDGIFDTGIKIPFTDIVDYDYEKQKNKLSVYFSYRETKGKTRIVSKEIVFPQKRTEEVLDHLNKKIGKKYKRVKK